MLNDLMDEIKEYNKQIEKFNFELIHIKRLINHYAETLRIKIDFGNLETALSSLKSKKKKQKNETRKIIEEKLNSYFNRLLIIKSIEEKIKSINEEIKILKKMESKTKKTQDENKLLEALTNFAAEPRRAKEIMKERRKQIRKKHEDFGTLIMERNNEALAKQLAEKEGITIPNAKKIIEKASKKSIIGIITRLP